MESWMLIVFYGLWSIVNIIYFITQNVPGLRTRFVMYICHKKLCDIFPGFLWFTKRNKSLKV